MRSAVIQLAVSSIEEMLGREFGDMEKPAVRDILDSVYDAGRQCAIDAASEHVRESLSLLSTLP